MIPNRRCHAAQAMDRLFVALALGALALPPLYAADIYRWVDDTGRVHLSDRVPEPFRNSAIRIDSRQFELTPQQRSDAAVRAAQDRARAAESADRDAKTKDVQAAESAPAAPGVQARTPAAPTDAASVCASLRRRFDQSADCFAPFVNANGSIKPEAFQICGPAVPAPVLECSSTPAY
jgi:hypothetical protein